jgi:hypothetical protein
MPLPPKRKPARSGIERAPQREWPRHRKFVRSHACSVPGCENGPIEFAHIRTAANAGTSIKPADWNGVSLCRDHHAETHRGERTFEAKYKIDLKALAAEFARKSPDIAMREAMVSYQDEEAAA